MSLSISGELCVNITNERLTYITSYHVRRLVCQNVYRNRKVINVEYY